MGLNILIAGAGIGGLAAAIALRDNGHQVTLFEQSTHNVETGAAIFLPPNANSVLRHYGFLAERYGANLLLGRRTFSLEDKLVHIEEHPADEFPSPWHLIHRQRLHAGLKEFATNPTRSGDPVKVETRNRVISVDANSATLTLEDGRVVKGDVVLGADGLWSKTRAAVQSLQPDAAPEMPFSIGRNCYRFLIPRQTLLDNEITRPIFEEESVYFQWTGEGRAIISYPCDDNTLMNFVAIHPSSLSIADSKDWHARGSKASVTELFANYSPVVHEISKMATPDTVKLYPLMDLKPLSTYINNRLALLGDAAHPFAPFMGQGGAQAIEDGISLGVFLSSEVTSEQVPARLKLYEQSRYTRANRIQESTRKVGMTVIDRVHYEDFHIDAEFEFALRYNEIDHAQEILRLSQGQQIAVA